ncbi:MAG: HAD-IIB family hydrolase [Patescibacteria group bacterium]
MLPNKKVISFDLDGTLAVSKSPITPEMGELVKQLIKKIIVVVTSGGSLKQFQTQFLPPFLNDNSFLPYIHNLILLPTSATQQYEYDKVKKDWQITDKELLDENIKTKIKKFLKEIIDSGLYEIPPNPAGEIVEDRDTQITFSGCGQLANIEAKRAWDPDKRKRQKIVSILEPLLPEVSFLINAYSSIDIVPKGYNKGVGLTKLLNKLGFQKSDMVFVGDGLFPGGNDYSVKEAGFETIAVKGPEETAKFIQGWIG